MKGWIVAMALVPGAGSGFVHAEDTGVANERPPMSREALERHWGVDCAAVSRDLRAWSTRPGTVISPGTVEHLRLCAAIHNPPGEAATASCPDYAGALALLAQPGGQDTAARAEVGARVYCTP